MHLGESQKGEWNGAIGEVKVLLNVRDKVGLRKNG